MWGLRCVVPAATVTIRAKPHAQQQPPRDLEVERSVMGQRYRSQSVGEVQRCNPLNFLCSVALLLYGRRTWGCCS